MSTVIRLDRDAVAALFPEGSTQRLELCKGVIEQVARSLAASDLKSFSLQFKRDVEAAVKMAMLEHVQVDPRSWQDALKVTDTHRAAVKAEVNAAVSEARRAAIAEAQKHFGNALLGYQLQDLADAAAERAVSAAVDAAVGERVRARVAAVLAALESPPIVHSGPALGESRLREICPGCRGPVTVVKNEWHCAVHGMISDVIVGVPQ